MSGKINARRINYIAPTILTISSKAVTLTQYHHIIAAETGTSEDLDTITGVVTTPSGYASKVLLKADAGDTITVKNSGGNIRLNTGTDFVLSAEKQIELAYNGTYWTDTGDPGASGTGDMTKAVYDAANVTEQLTGLTASQTLTNKTLTTPTVGDFTNATHDHADAAGGGTLAVAASDVEMLEIGTATYDDVQDWSNLTQSAACVDGCAVTDNGDGTVAVALGKGIIKSTDSNIGANYFFDIAADPSVSLSNNAENWVYIDYNAGSPDIKATITLSSIDTHTEVVIAKVWREGTDAHIVETGQLFADFARKVCFRQYELDAIIRASGAVISETGTRNIASTAGVMYCASNRITTAAEDTSVADTFSYWYPDGIGGWTEVASQTQIDNTQYYGGGGSRLTLSNNRYGVHWVYICHEGDLHVQYGVGDYFLSEADAAQPPSPPPMLTSIAVLAAKIIIEKSASSFTSVDSAYESDFIGSASSDHGNLAGLSDDDHTQYALLDGRATGQTIIGGTASGDDLTLETTSDGTKGDYIFSEMTSAGVLQNTSGGVVTGGNTVAIAQGGTGQTAQTAAFDALAPTTTKGDVIVHNGSDNIRLAIGTNDHVLTADSGEASGVKWAAAGAGGSSYVYLRDEKTQNTAGGTFTSGAWQTRDLNIETDPDTICSLSSNQFTLDAGTYRINVNAPANRVNYHQIRLYNTTDTATILTGTAEYAPTGADYQKHSFISGSFTVAASKALEIQHYGTATRATVGFGLAGNITTEVFTLVEICKVG